MARRTCNCDEVADGNSDASLMLSVVCSNGCAAALPRWCVGVRVEWDVDSALRTPAKRQLVQHWEPLQHNEGKRCRDGSEAR